MVASYALRVPRAGTLRSASFRPRLTAAALAVRLTVPVIRVRSGLSPPSEYALTGALKKRAGKPCPVKQRCHLIYRAFLLPGGRHTIHLYKDVAAGCTDNDFFRDLLRATGAFFVSGFVQTSPGYPGIQVDRDQYCQHCKYYICQNHMFVLSDRVVCPVKDGRETAWYIF
jgi:hypothetical protein